jgi:hypothetical protein
LAQSVEAKIVYTPAHRVIGPDSKYLLDLNHDGIPDFTITNSYNCPDSCVSIVVAKPANGTHGVEGPLSSRGHASWAYALTAGVIIGRSAHFCQCSGVRWQRRLQPRWQPLVQSQTISRAQL